MPFQLFDNGNERIYLAQSGLTGANGPDARSTGRPLYSSEASSYSLNEGKDQLVVDSALQRSRGQLHQALHLQARQYDFAVRYLIDNQSAQPWTGSLFAQIKRDNSADPSSTTATGTATYLGAALWTADEPYKKVSLDDMDDKAIKESVQGGWVAWLQHYFVTAWIADKDQTNQVMTRKDAQGNYIIGLYRSALNIPAGGKAEVGASLYAGPKDQDNLSKLSPGLELTVDYGFLWFIAQPIFWLLEHIHSIFGNWGWSIIALTIIIKLAFFPLSAASYKSMARMRAVAPKMQALKEQYGDDRQKMSQGMMELYKKEKINPLGGCLPILVQMPVFLALYWVLLESVEMRQAPWLGLDRRPVDQRPVLHPAVDHGCHHVHSAAAQPDAAGPDASQGAQADAGDLHLLLPVVPGRSGAVLGGQQHPVHCPAVVHYPADRTGRESRLIHHLLKRRPLVGASCYPPFAFRERA